MAESPVRPPMRPAKNIMVQPIRWAQQRLRQSHLAMPRGQSKCRSGSQQWKHQRRTRSGCFGIQKSFSCFSLLAPLVIQCKGVVHGAGAMAQVQHGGQCAGNIRLGAAHSGFQIIALCQVGGNGAGQGAAGAVGVGVINALAVEPGGAAIESAPAGRWHRSGYARPCTAHCSQISG